MLEHAHYFGSEPSQLFGIVHLPARSMSTAVVVCPPVGYENVCAHHGVRELATQLSAEQFPVLRFDYSGTGNSLRGEGGHDELDGWIRSVVLAIDESCRLGADRVVLIGLRFGALLAAQVAAIDPRVCGLVLWDPVTSGRRYVRTLQLLSSVVKPVDEGERVDYEQDGAVIGGTRFTSRTLGAMRSVTWPELPCELPVLVAHREHEEPVAVNASADLLVVDGMEQFLDVDAELSVLPAATIGKVSSWVVSRFSEPADHCGDPVFETSTTASVAGLAVRHRARRYGDASLFGIDSEPLSSGPGRAVVMLNNGVAPNIGPGGAWVRFERRLLRDGWRVVRLDIGGIGNSPARPGEHSNDSYPRSAGADIGCVVKTLHSEGVSEIVLLGLCSGSLNAYDAVASGVSVSAIVSINGRFDKPYTDTRCPGAHRAARATNRLLAVPLGKTPLFPIIDRVPSACWRALDLLRLVGPPSAAIGRAEAAGVFSLLVFGPGEWGLRALQRRDAKRLDRLRRSPHVDVVEIRPLDHSMFSPAAEEQVMDLVLEFVRGLADRRRSNPPNDAEVRG